MPQDEIHVGDIGTRFEVTLKDGDTVLDISAASKMQIWFGRPTSNALKKDANFVTGGTDGKLEYYSVADDLNEAGEWFIQAYVEFGSGKWHSDAIPFDVHENVDI